MDSETPAIDEAMNATFESKITVNTSYVEKENLTNEITILATSQNDDYSKDKETFKIDITSASKNIIEYSYDNKKWTNVTPTKTLTLEKEYTKEGSYLIYVKDEVGNVSSTTCSSTFKVDKNSPSTTMSTSVFLNGITISLTASDSGSGIATYYYSKDGGKTFVTSSSSSYTFLNLSSGSYSLVSKVSYNAGWVSSNVTSSQTIAADLNFYSSGKFAYNFASATACTPFSSYYINNTSAFKNYCQN